MTKEIGIPQFFSTASCTVYTLTCPTTSEPDLDQPNCWCFVIALQGACTQTTHPHTDTRCNTLGTHTQYTQTTHPDSIHNDNIPIARSTAHAHRQLVGFQCDVWTTSSRTVWPRRVKPTVQQFLNSRFLTLSETAPFGLSCSLIGQTRPMGGTRLLSTL